MTADIDLLRKQLDELRARLDEPEEIIRAIREGEVDAFVVHSKEGEQIYSLRSVDALYRRMVEEMSEGAVALDASGLILYCNAYFASVVGASRDSLVGRSIFTFVPEESRAVFAALQSASDAPMTGELALVRPDGALVPAQISLNRIKPEGGDHVFCVIITDLTESRRREQLLLEARRKDEFLAMLAHELRNPLAAISSAVHVLLHGGLPEAQLRRTHEMIERQVSQLTRLVDDLLDASRISRGQIRVDMRDVDLATVIARAVETATPQMTQRRHELHIALPGEATRVLGDDARLAQVVSNLLHNAAKFTPDGGHVSVKLEASGGEARIIVRDDGLGIEPNMFVKIFDVFTQVEGSSRRTHDGLGIGLALVRHIVELHGGRVTVASDGRGAGAEFVVILPLLGGP